MSTIKLTDGRVVDEKLYRERFQWPANAQWRSCKDLMQPCKYCLRPAFKCTPLGENASRPTECEGCWEVTHLEAAFLRDGVRDPDDVPAAHAFVITALVALGYDVSQ